MKKRKVDRSTSWYGQNKARNRRKLVFYAVLLCSMAAGWYLFDPVSDILLNTDKNIVEENVEPSGQGSLPEPVETGKLVPLTPAIDERPSVENIYILNVEEVATPERLEATVQRLKQKSATGVVLPIKDNRGNILVNLTDGYENAGYNLPSVSKRLRQNKLLVYGMVYSYEDNTYTIKNRDSAVKYMDSPVVWLDNYADRGGKSWIDPFSSKAQDYILDIVNKVSSYCDAVLLASVQFPRGEALNKATFGGSFDERTAVLKDFLTRATAIAKGNGSKVYPILSAYELLEKKSGYYGKTPNELTSMDYILEVDMSDFRYGLIVGDTIITETSTISELIDAISANSEPMAVLGQPLGEYKGSTISFLEEVQN